MLRKSKWMLLVIFLVMIPLSAFADNSYRLHIRYLFGEEQSPVAGAVFTLTRVAGEQNGEMVPVPGLTEEELMTAEGAASGVGRICSEKPDRTFQVSRTTDAFGELAYYGLKEGIYLVQETKPAEGYDLSRPFLVTFPDDLSDKEQMELTAAPKPVVLTESGIAKGREPVKDKPSAFVQSRSSAVQPERKVLSVRKTRAVLTGDTGKLVLPGTLAAASAAVIFLLHRKKGGQ
jgi:hypothetical protein